ncbi:MAG: hypothetical protein HUJ26_16010 [Planctomycetaceae bacterium]|nr:hypothetical protein [Planctomycetaceae bacterium]
MSRRFKTRWFFLLLQLSVCGNTGCGYVMGSFHANDVRTVAVPVFETNSPRRGLEYQLTEAVQNEIKARTPYRIAKEPHADTRLVGRIVDVRKDVLSQNGFGDPRSLQASFAVRVVWEDLRNGNVIAEQTIPLDQLGLSLDSTAAFSPELGQSQATATQQAIDKLAAQIVDRMEAPW